MRFLVFLLSALLLLFTSACGDDSPPTDGGMDGATDSGTGTCEPPEELCGTRCVNTDNDGRNCGSCDFECAAGSFCSAGMCSRTCPSGTVACGGSCADLATDTNHCGDCGNACADDEACRGGSCTCPEGYTLCGDVCVNPDSDPAHCGVCDRTCDDSQICNLGTCTCAMGARESECNDMLDDDCDGMIDCADSDCVGATRSCMGMCGAGIETCEGGDVDAWGMCVGGSGEAEICGDGIDQDCDGADLRMEDTYEPNNDCASCTLVTTDIDPTITIMASIDSVDDNIDCFKFNVDDGFLSGETITIDLTDVPATEDYDLRLYRNLESCMANTVLATSLGGLRGEDEQIEWTESFGSDDSGTFYVFVDPWINSHSCEEEYTLRFEGLN